MSSGHGRIPRRFGAQNGVGDGEELVHAGDDGDHGRFVIGAMALVTRREHGIAADGREHRHIQRGAHRGAAARDRGGRPRAAALAGLGRDPDERGEGAVIDGAEFGHAGQQRDDGGRADAGNGAQQARLGGPGRIGRDAGGEFAIERGQQARGLGEQRIDEGMDLDRGSLEVDNGHFQSYEYVFGATAAAALYRREMIDDIAVNGEFFDSDFFVYREDADVAWRAQLLGWKCLYVPYARGYHVRKVFPGNRRALPPEINMHSVKNRFLLRIKNISWDLYWRNFFSITARDIVVVSCCLLREHTSLKAFPFLFRNWKSVVAKRREIMRRQRVDDTYMASWFDFSPVSKPAPKKFTAALTRSKAARR